MKDQIMANKWGQDEQNRGIPELDEAGSLEENWQIVDIFVVGLLNYWVMWKLIQYSRTRMPMCRPSMAHVIGSNFKKGYTCMFTDGMIIVLWASYSTYIFNALE